MKILISTGFYNTYKSTGINVGLNIAQSFIRLGHEAELVGETTEEAFDDSSSPIKIHRIKKVPDRVLKAENHLNNYLSTCSEEKHKQMVRKYVFQHPIKSLRIAFYKNQKFLGCFYHTYAQSVEKLIRAENFDVLICIVYPFDMAKDLLLKDDLPCIKIYYQLDPYGTSYALPPEQTEERKKLESKVMLASDSVAVPPELYKEYSRDDLYFEAVKKSVVVDFPALIEGKNPLVKGAISFEKRSINLLYCGTLVDKQNCRETKTIIPVLLKLLLMRSDIKIYFLGNVENDGVYELLNKNPERVLIIPPVIPEVAAATMQECDFLLNIGNYVPNMVPSKIFSYFYSLKPIISFEKNQNIPEIHYLKRYPLGIIIYENEIINDAAIRIDRFICDNINMTADETIVKEEYKMNTPEYVVEQLLQMIYNSKNGERNENHSSFEKNTK